MSKMRLGLVCISEILKAKQKLGFKTMTRKSFNGYKRAAAITLLSKRILHNVDLVYKILCHCSDVGIGHYRLSSSLFPLVTDQTLNLCYDDLPDMSEIRQRLSLCGGYARANDISISMHPDQFNVLASYNEVVVDRTIGELNHQSAILDMMGYPHSYSTPMCLHLNCSPRFKIEDCLEYKNRFVANLGRCSTGVQSRLALENEDKAFWNCYNLYTWFHDVCPLVYDNLHDACNPSEQLDRPYPELFVETWNCHRPVFHWSEGIGGGRSHTARASVMPDVVANNRHCTWEVELKDKDYAILEIVEKYNC